MGRRALWKWVSSTLRLALDGWVVPFPTELRMILAVLGGEGLGELGGLGEHILGLVVGSLRR